MRKIIYVTVCIVAICVSLIKLPQQNFQTEAKEVASQNLSNNTYNLEYDMSYTYNLENVDDLYDNNEYIAIIHINKVYPSTTYREKTNEYIMPYTPGEATILKEIKGDFKSDKISFLRLGGVVTYDDYIKSLKNDADKFSELFTKDNVPTYINSQKKGDISIEEGKTYLAYMVRDSKFHNSNEYTIDAFEYGLREVKFKDSSSLSDYSNITIKNNKTGQYESLNSAVNKNILKKLTTNATQ